MPTPLDGRPRAPHYLTKTQRKHWNDIVANEASSTFETVANQNLLVELVRNLETKVDVELVLASAPDSVEIAQPSFDLSKVTYNADIITLELTIDSLEKEPYPAGKFTPAGFPGLFG